MHRQKPTRLLPIPSIVLRFDVILPFQFPSLYNSSFKPAFVVFIEIVSLDGASMDAVRQRAKDSRPADSENSDGSEQVVLIVDDEVLSGAQPGRNDWVKVVEVDYDPEKHKGNARFGQHYFGWMKASTKDLVYLWEE